MPVLKIEMKEPKVTGAAKGEGLLPVWAVPETESISPTTGNRLQDGLEDYIKGPAKGTHRLANEIWNCLDRTVKLEGSRNWFCGFQLIADLGGKTRKLQIRADDFSGPQTLPAATNIKVYRIWYVRGAKGKQQDGWFGDPLIPLSGAVTLPAKDNAVEGQANQAFFVDVYIPHQAKSGTYKTILHVTDLDDATYKADVAAAVKVHPVTPARQADLHCGAQRLFQPGEALQGCAGWLGPLPEDRARVPPPGAREPLQSEHPGLWPGRSDEGQLRSEDRRTR